ncbi:MAG: hypothetical protein SGARI_005174 [Bacillariaceae sp.]
MQWVLPRDDSGNGAETDPYDALLEYSIDSFLRGDYDRPFQEDAAAPLPGLSPKDTVELSLGSLRKLNDPEPAHGAACFVRFCIPLGRGERWSPAVQDKADNEPSDLAWKELLRGSLTPTMFARRISASEDFSMLVEWDTMTVQEGEVLEESVGFCNIKLDGGDGDEFQVKLRRGSTSSA